MSEIQSLAAPKASFDRRSVVKTAAWSVPVIAAAIAAPAAAASVVTPPAPTGAVTATLVGLETPVSYLGNPEMTGTTPKTVKIVNSTSAAINDSAFIQVTLTPITSKAAGIRIARMTVGSASVGTWNADNVITATFTVPVNLAPGAAQSFDFDLTSYSHNAKGAHQGVWTYAMNMVVSLKTFTPSDSGFVTFKKK